MNDASVFPTSSVEVAIITVPEGDRKGAFVSERKAYYNSRSVPRSDALQCDVRRGGDPQGLTEQKKVNENQQPARPEADELGLREESEESGWKGCICFVKRCFVF